MDKEYSPLTYDEARHIADIAKKLTRDEAIFLQNILLRRAQEAGVSSENVFPLIYSINERFVDEDNEMRRKAIEAEIRQKGIMQEEKIDVDDDQIVTAIKWTLPKFNSDWDWGGIYRILVSCCGFPAVKTEFVKRMARLRIYPKDDIVKITDRMSPAIYQNEYHGHPFSYQAVQRGCPKEWPDHYFEWKDSETSTKDFSDRKRIAAIFRDNLIKAIKEQKPYYGVLS